MRRPSTDTLTPPQVLAIETAELDAWRDMYRAVPDAFRRQHDPELIEIDQVLLTRCRSIPFSHFNSVLSLGLVAPATEATLDALIAAYATAEIRRFAILHHPFCQPEALPDWMLARGLGPKPGWDRVYRFGRPSALDPAPDRGEVAFVTAETARAWAGFIDRWYGLATSPWLVELVGRPGWFHAVLVRDGETVAARSMFLEPGACAWFGVEAPVPGLMAPSFEDDQCLLHALVTEAASRGVHTFVGDVEAIATAREGSAYDRWAALGFTVGYHRTHYVP